MKKSRGDSNHTSHQSHDTNKNLPVHRLRVGNHLPSPIKALAVDNLYSNRIALGREDGEIEILDPDSSFLVQARIAGEEGFKLQGLVWALHNDEPRLFGISLRGFLFEADLQKLSTTATPSSPLEVFGGAAWCLAASPRAPLLAVGGERGVVRLFRYFSLDGLETLPHSLATSSDRVLSLAYHPSLPRIFAGCNDGTIRAIDENTSQTLFRMAAEVSPKGVPPSLWSLAVLEDSTLVSGDSLGQVRVWDGSLGVLMQSFPAHLGDVLCLATASSPSSSTSVTSFFSAGVDGKVNCFARSSAALDIAGSVGGSAGVWHLTQSHRLHSHDIFTLAVFREKEFLLSGGLDSKICFYSLNQFDLVKPFWLPLIRSNELVSSSEDCQSILVKYYRHVDLWKGRFVEKEGDEDEEEADDRKAEEKGEGENSCKLFLRMSSKDSHHLTHVSLSPNGFFLLVCSKFATKLFSLSEKKTVCEVNEVSLPLSFSSAPRTITATAFSKDSKQIVAWDARNELFLLMTLTSSSLEWISSHPLEAPQAQISFTSPVDRKLARQVKKILFSPDSNYVAAVSCSNNVTIYNWKKFMKRWSLPPFQNLISDIAFTAENILLVLLSSGSLFAYDIEKMLLLKEENVRFEGKGCKEIYSMSGIAASSLSSSSSYICCYGPMHSTLLSFSQKKTHETSSKSSKGKKRKTEEADLAEEKPLDSEIVSHIERYRNILGMGMASDGSLVVVENPWTNLHEHFPEVISRKRYGT